MSHKQEWDARGLGAVETIVGHPAAGGQGPSLNRLSPLTGARLPAVPTCSPDDVSQALLEARAAWPAWQTAGSKARRQVLLRVHDELWRRRDELLDLIQWESGKSRKDAFEEVADVALTARHYAKHAGRLLRERRKIGVLPGLTAVRVRHVPKGVVGVISPWNYPFTLVASDALAALAAGNAVVLKPDGLTALTALAVARLFHDAGVPKSVFQVLPGSGRDLGGPLIAGADYLMFTGSTATGREVAAQAGRALIGVSAELGGKNPLYVAADAPLARALPGALAACFSNAGQLCVSIERLYVHQDVWEVFVPAFVAAARDIQVGATMDWSCQMGPLISPAQLEAVDAQVRDAQAKGAKILAGGRRLPEVGPTAYAPTVLEGVNEEMEVCRSETFGPVVSLYPVGSDREAIDRANDTPYGLNASVWASPRRGLAIARQLRAGTVNVNEGYAAAWASLNAPMGGMGASGLGRRHGAEGLTKYTEAQTIALQRCMRLGAPGPLGEEQWAQVLQRFIQARRYLGL